MILPLCSQSCEPVSKNLLKDCCIEKVTNVRAMEAWRIQTGVDFYIFTYPSDLFWSSWRGEWSCTFTWPSSWVAKQHQRKARLQVFTSLSFSSSLVLGPLFWHTWKPQEIPLWGWGLASSVLPGHDGQHGQAFRCGLTSCAGAGSLQGCGRQELLQLPQTKYLPALVLGWISLDVCHTALSVCQWAIFSLWLMDRQKCLWVGRCVTSWIPEQFFSLFQEIRESILFDQEQ